MNGDILVTRMVYRVRRSLYISRVLGKNPLFRIMEACSVTNMFRVAPSLLKYLAFTRTSYLDRYGRDRS